MILAQKTPIEQLVIDPFAGKAAPLTTVVEHGPFTALAQGGDWRGKLERLDAVLAQLPQTEMPVTHRFSRGVYARELFIPKGTVLTGRIHKYSQINILLRGDISVLTEDGIKRIQAPFVIESPAGAKRAGYAHEDTVWMTVCGTATTDADVLEDELTTRTYAEYEAFCAGLLVEGV
jgi:quercetin dioxygenase-like cupin family protein